MSTSVVKRALYTPEISDANVTRKHPQHNPTRELHSQLGSAKKEIDRLCHRVYRNHKNIVHLRGWGLCLDTFEAKTSLNTRIPLLILERATCDLGDFLASSNYERTSYDMLLKICMDIGTGLGALHRGDVTHGDMKPENVLLFAVDSTDPKKPGRLWTAKLCDFGCAEVKDSEIPAAGGCQNMYTGAEYNGTYGWTPPEALLSQRFDFEGLKRCDVFVYGLIVWWVFARQPTRGDFDVCTSKREKRVPPVIEDEIKIKQYLRDRAYRDAAAEITKCWAEGAGLWSRSMDHEYDLTKIRDRLEVLNRVESMLGRGNSTNRFKVVEQFKRGAGWIPSLSEVRRILQVLRSALQPVPAYRDPRPWKYLDQTYYPTFRNIDENPGQSPHDNSLPSTQATMDLVSKAAHSRNERLRVIGEYSELLSNRARRILPDLAIPSPRQKALRRVCEIESDKLPLGYDANSTNFIEHTHGMCLDLVPFISRLMALLTQEDPKIDIYYEIYAYARIRSRFKICCWPPKFPNALEALLCNESTKLSYVRMWDFTVVPDYFIQIIVWLARGNIGARELQSLADSDDKGDILWSWALCHINQHRLSLQVSLSTPQSSSAVPLSSKKMNENYSDLFLHLFLERGCFIGHHLGSDISSHDRFNTTGLTVPCGPTVLSRCLRSYAESLGTLREQSMKDEMKDTIIRACRKVIQTISLSPSTTYTSSTSETVLHMARKRFFFRGESPDRVDDLNFAQTNYLEHVLANTVLHEAVHACCYDAVQYFVKAATIPLVVQDKNGETVLNLAVRLKGDLEARKPAPGDWQLIQLNLIIGLLSQSSRFSFKSSGIALGWEALELTNNLVGYRESTINPQNPSITFKRPEFSLLEETQVTLGSQRGVKGGLTYKFDLVRFMQTSQEIDGTMSQNIFDYSWYENDAQVLQQESSKYRDFFGGRLRWPSRVNLGLQQTPGSLISRVSEFDLVQFMLNSRRSIWIVFAHNYVNILTICIPISMVMRRTGSQTTGHQTALFVITLISLIPIPSILHFLLGQLLPYFVHARISTQFPSLFTGLGACQPELFVGSSRRGTPF